MKRWPLYLVRIAEALIVLVVIYYEPTYCVRGILWREAFFDGKPTSYWRDELHHWEVSKHLGYGWLGYSETVYQRNPSAFERFRERWLPAPKLAGNPDVVFIKLVAQMMTRQNGPRIIHGEADAILVLQELLDDPSPKIRLFAQIGLGMNPKIPGDE